MGSGSSSARTTGGARGTHGVHANLAAGAAALIAVLLAGPSEAQATSITYANGFGYDNDGSGGGAPVQVHFNGGADFTDYLQDGSGGGIDSSDVTTVGGQNVLNFDDTNLNSGKNLVAVNSGDFVGLTSSTAGGWFTVEFYANSPQSGYAWTLSVNDGASDDFALKFTQDGGNNKITFYHNGGLVDYSEFLGGATF